VIMDCERRACHARGAERAGWACAIIASMESTPLILASASPRRRRLLAWLEAPYESVATEIEEDLSSPLRLVPPVLARSLAADKARAARANALAGAREGDREGAGAGATVLAFDTIVMLDGQVLGKPADRADAERMLRALSGRTHTVVTGVAVFRAGREDPETFAVSTPVTMRELDDATIAGWLEGDEALGCAGAYNIERHLASVEDGECYQNVAGLPLCHVHARLAKYGLAGASAPLAACEAARGVVCPLGRKVCAIPTA
jgi:septum formation protein